MVEYQVGHDDQVKSLLIRNLCLPAEDGIQRLTPDIALEMRIVNMTVAIHMYVC